MDSRIKKLILICLIIFLIMLLTVCVPKRPLNLEKIFSRPDIDFEIFKNLAILEFIPNPQVKKDKKFDELVEDEFQKKGYKIVSRDEFHSVMDEFGYSAEDLSNPNVLKKVRERLHITAIITGEVQEYDIKKKKDYIFFIWEYGASTIVTNKYICDISVTMEMSEVQKGSKVWSCSVSCNQKKGKPEKLIRNMIRSSIETIPRR